jgi:hypothetical protein
MLEDLLARGKYKNLQLSITDDPDQAIQAILDFPGSQA